MSEQIESEITDWEKTRIHSARRGHLNMLIPTVEQCRQFCAAATGVSGYRFDTRVLLLVEFIQQHSLALSEIKLVSSTDDNWSTRRNRSPAEMQGVALGINAVKTSTGSTRICWYVVPREELPEST